MGFNNTHYLMDKFLEKELKSINFVINFNLIEFNQILYLNQLLKVNNLLFKEFISLPFSNLNQDQHFQYPLQFITTHYSNFYFQFYVNSYSFFKHFIFFYFNDNCSFVGFSFLDLIFLCELINFFFESSLQIF